MDAVEVELVAAGNGGKSVKFTMPRAWLTFNVVVAFAEKTFGRMATSQQRLLRYEDDEGDCITVATEAEFSEAVEVQLRRMGRPSLCFAVSVASPLAVWAAAAAEHASSIGVAQDSEVMHALQEIQDAIARGADQNELAMLCQAAIDAATTDSSSSGSDTDPDGDAVMS